MRRQQHPFSTVNSCSWVENSTLQEGLEPTTTRLHANYIYMYYIYISITYSLLLFLRLPLRLVGRVVQFTGCRFLVTNLRIYWINCTLRGIIVRVSPTGKTGFYHQRFLFHHANIMMTSPSGKFFHVTAPLCGEFAGHGWIPLTKASDAELWCFLWSAPEQTVE